MSDRVEGPQRDGSASEGMAKTDRRAAAKRAAAAGARAKQRRAALTGAVAGLAIVVVLIAGVVVLLRHPDWVTRDVAAGNPSPVSETEPNPAPTTAPEAPADPGSPPLPPGADPALANKPAATGGSGELTKLTVTPLIKGTGPAARAGQTITVNYVGVFYKTGEEFDSSWKRSTPFSFALGQGNVIQGWDQGLVGVKVGSRVQLDIPSSLAYGDGVGGGRPAGPLRFIVDVLAVH